MRVKLFAVVLSTIATLGLVAAHSADAAAPYRTFTWQQMQQEQARQFMTLQDPTQAAPGVNRWDCKPSKAHPNPIVMVHGFENNQFNNWAFLGPTLANLGYCAFSLNHGGIVPPPFVLQGLGRVDDSAFQVAAFIDRVLATTGARKVDLVGHSLGGFLVLYTPKAIGGVAGKVGKVVSIAPPTHGLLGDLASIADTLRIRPLVNLVPLAPSDLLKDSPAMTRLHAGPIAQRGIKYTVFASRHDTSIPTETSFVREPGVTNILVQDVCPNDRVGHSGQSYDSGEVTMITNALDPKHPKPVVCVSGPTQ